MALIEIPVNKESPDNKFTISLDKIVYSIRIRQNSRTGQFFMDISTEDETLIAAGIALVTGYPFMEEFSDERLPPGNLFCMDITDQDRDPDETNFGESVFLLYNEALSG